jgi:alkylated DNA repair dioxygenase AlkB
VTVNALQRSLLGGGEIRVDDHARFERIVLDDGSWIDIAREWLLGADTLLDAIVDAVDWKQGRRRMYDRVLDDPRLSRWYGRGDPLPHPALAAIGARLDRQLGVPLAGPALNYYRDGADSVAWHADRELRELRDTRIAILTLGAKRPFLIRPKGGGASRNLAPAAGDVLVMGGACQLRWEHSVPKTRAAAPRISCSWRWSNRAAGDPPATRPAAPS